MDRAMFRFVSLLHQISLQVKHYETFIATDQTIHLVPDRFPGAPTG